MLQIVFFHFKFVPGETVHFIKLVGGIANQFLSDHFYLFINFTIHDGFDYSMCWKIYY